MNQRRASEPVLGFAEDRVVAGNAEERWGGGGGGKKGREGEGEKLKMDMEMEMKNEEDGFWRVFVEGKQKLVGIFPLKIVARIHSFS